MDCPRNPLCRSRSRHFRTRRLWSSKCLPDRMSRSFIVRNTPTISRFVKGNPKRQDSPLYPESAVREALINALAHRNYSGSSGGVSIHVFPKRLEIWNSGPFPEGVTADSLGRGQLSVLRHPDIAHVLYLRGLMEKAGRGSVLMAHECQKSGLPAPK